MQDFWAIYNQAFILNHLTSFKKFVRDLDAFLFPTELLKLFAPAGATVVYYCTRLADNNISCRHRIYHYDFPGTLGPEGTEDLEFNRHGLPVYSSSTAISIGSLEINFRYHVRCRVSGSSHSVSSCTQNDASCFLWCSNRHVTDYQIAQLVSVRNLETHGPFALSSIRIKTVKSL